METGFNIALPQQLKEWLEHRASSAGFGSASELVEDLVRKEREREAFGRLEDYLEKVIDAETPTTMTKGDWEKIRAEGRRKVEAQKHS